VLVFVVIIISAGLIFIIAEQKKSKEEPIDRIILVTIDTLRADHLGSYGYPRRTSPFIDTLSREGIQFQRAFSSMSLTAPSLASIFTSLYPLQHNVHTNDQKLNDLFLTLAELLSTMDYRTAAFVSVPFLGSLNLHQGFDIFTIPNPRSYMNVTWPKISEKANAGEIKGLKGPVYGNAMETIYSAIKWVDNLQPTDRFFLWVHLYDPHTPYYPPASFLEIFTNESTQERESSIRFLLEEHHIDFDFYGNNTEEMLGTINRYDGEILFADTELKRLYKHLQRKGLDSHSLWIITSDHGEGLGNHRYLVHDRHIYNEQVRVPLIFRFSSGAFQGLSIDQVVEHVDILPTVMELIGGELRNQIKNIQGVSLVALFSENQEVLPIKDYAFSERIVPQGISLPKDYEGGEEEREKFALQNSEYKYIYKTKGTDEFFDLRKDPYELKNMVGSDTEEEKELRNLIILKVKQLRQDNIDIAKPESVVDKETIEQLKALGYIQ